MFPSSPYFSQFLWTAFNFMHIPMRDHTNMHASHSVFVEMQFTCTHVCRFPSTGCSFAAKGRLHRTVIITWSNQERSTWRCRTSQVSFIVFLFCFIFYFFICYYFIINRGQVSIWFITASSRTDNAYILYSDVPEIKEDLAEDAAAEHVSLSIYRNTGVFKKIRLFWVKSQYTTFIYLCKTFMATFTSPDLPLFLHKKSAAPTKNLPDPPITKL